MKRKLAVCLLAAALLPACTTTRTAQNARTSSDYKGTRYANNAIEEPPPPAEGPGDIPNPGPADLMRDPAYVPSPLLRASATSSP
jgi:hypothetical protein